MERAKLDVEAQPLTTATPSHANVEERAKPAPHSLDLEDIVGYNTSKEDGPVAWVVTGWKGTSVGVRVGVIAAWLLLAVSTLILVFASISSAATKSDGVRFFVLGDWGRQGTTNQSQVAELMGRKAATLQPKFVISTGDNMYPHGLNSTEDPLFDESFRLVYTAPALQVPWHAVLGNHDYSDTFNGSCLYEDHPSCTESSMHELTQRLRERDWRWHCERSYVESFNNGLLDLFFIDTSPFITGYRYTPWARVDGGILQQDWEQQLKEIEARLAASTAAWKILIGHHPPRSNGNHGNNTEIMQHIEPLMEKYGANVYFAGHDHNLEHLHMSDKDLHVFVSGGGSDCDRGFDTAVDSMYQFPSSGFAAATVTRKQLEVSFYTLEGGATAAYTVVLNNAGKNKRK